MSKFKIFLICIGLLVFPIILNFVLQLKISGKVIGNEVTWLNFWGVYLGVIFSALMVYITYKTLHTTNHINLSQRKKEWLYTFREHSAELITLASKNNINVLAQRLLWGQESLIMEQAMELNSALQRNTFLITALLKEYDELFMQDKSKVYIEQINIYLQPFLDSFQEFVEYTVICDYLTGCNYSQSGMNKTILMKSTMIANGFGAIYECLCKLEKLNRQSPKFIEHYYEVRKETLKQITSQLRSWDSNRFEQLLLKVCKDESRNIYSRN